MNPYEMFVLSFSTLAFGKRVTRDAFQETCSSGGRGAAIKAVVGRMLRYALVLALIALPNWFSVDLDATGHLVTYEPYSLPLTPGPLALACLCAVCA